MSNEQQALINAVAAVCEKAIGHKLTALEERIAQLEKEARKK